MPINIYAFKSSEKSQLKEAIKKQALEFFKKNLREKIAYAFGVAEKGSLCRLYKIEKKGDHVAIKAIVKNKYPSKKVGPMIEAAMRGEEESLPYEERVMVNIYNRLIVPSKTQEEFLIELTLRDADGRLAWMKAVGARKREERNLERGSQRQAQSARRASLGGEAAAILAAGPPPLYQEGGKVLNVNLYDVDGTQTQVPGELIFEFKCLGLAFEQSDDEQNLPSLKQGMRIPFALNKWVEAQGKPIANIPLQKLVDELNRLRKAARQSIQELPDGDIAKLLQAHTGDNSQFSAKFKKMKKEEESTREVMLRIIDEAKITPENAVKLQEQLRAGDQYSAAISSNHTAFIRALHAEALGESASALINNINFKGISAGGSKEDKTHTALHEILEKHKGNPIAEMHITLEEDEPGNLWSMMQGVKKFANENPAIHITIDPKLYKAGQLVVHINQCPPGTEREGLLTRLDVTENPNYKRFVSMIFELPITFGPEPPKPDFYSVMQSP